MKPRHIQQAEAKEGVVHKDDAASGLRRRFAPLMGALLLAGCTGSPPEGAEMVRICPSLNVNVYRVDGRLLLVNEYTGRTTAIAPDAVIAEVCI